MNIAPQELRDTNLEGHVLIAMPSMPDGRFARSVVYVCAHSEEGAMGLIINQLSSDVTFGKLLQQIDGFTVGEVPEQIAARPVHAGGPVETNRGFVLHTRDYFAPSATLSICDDICLTATTDILKAIANDDGPTRSILAVGYAGWAPGQLENEICRNGWLYGPAQTELVFDTETDEIYARAMTALGVHPSHLVSDAGHA